MLHRNLVYLATIADSNQNAQNAASVRSLMIFSIKLTVVILSCDFFVFCI